MKVICNRGALLEGINIASAAVAARTPKPELTCLKISANDERLTLAATDLEVAVRYADHEVQIEQPGETLLPADKIRDIVRESVDDTLTLEVAGDVANVRGGDSHFKIFTQPAGNFPPVPDFEGAADFELPGRQLKQLIGQTLFAAARESTRYAFNGVLVFAASKRITLVATDGRRLAMARGDLAGGEKLPKEGRRAIVPAKALGLVDKLIEDPEAPIAVQLRENQVLFRSERATLTTNLIEGQFPPYEDVIPKTADKKMTASTPDFLSAIRRASLLTTEESRGVRMQFSRSGLVLSSRSPDSGEATVTFPCKYDGADLEVAFNPVFLMDALKVVDGDEVVLELTAENRPGLLRGGAEFTYVIMPVNLQ